MTPEAQTGKKKKKKKDSLSVMPKPPDDSVKVQRADIHST